MEMTREYQGAVPEKALVRKFRKTGVTAVKVGGKEVLYKDYIKQKKEKETKVNIPKVPAKLKQKITSKSFTKSKRPTVKIKEYKAPSILNDPNRFFKDEFEEAKKELFFK